MLYCYCVAVLLFVLSYVLICVLYHCHRVLTQLQSTNISIYLSNWDGKPEHTTEDTQTIDEKTILNMDRRETVNRTKWQKGIQH